MGEELFRFVTGAAGTGKTYGIKKLVDDDPKAGVLCSTTGISAINLDTTTVNSLLGYFDLESIQDAYATGRLTGRLSSLAKRSRFLFIDEASMLDKRVFEILMMAIRDVNEYKTTKVPMGLVLVGDFCQLPPINADWVFNSDEWEEFARNTTKLTKFWRQTDTDFLEALQSARSGDGENAAERLRAIPTVTWRNSNNFKFDGTTIVGTNPEATRINKMMISELPDKRTFKIKPKTWGLEKGEWKHIKEELILKRGAYVMLLTNDIDPVNRSLGMLDYANGSCGHIVDVEDGKFLIEISKDGERTGKVVKISAIDREYASKEEIIRGVKGNWDEKKKRYIFGGIHYFPIRGAYASTVHRSQGLTLDKVQVDVRHPFMGEPAMCYVSLSRCKTPRGLTIVGTPDKLAARTCIHKEVLPYL